jgi:predicted transposase YbfD/YdcC
LLKRLDLQGVIIAINAMGCQTVLAEQVIEGQGDDVVGCSALHGAIALFLRLEH